MLSDQVKLLEMSEDEVSEWQKKIERIDKKLTEKYYDDSSRHTKIVGSVGRGTAIAGNSDYDVLYELPHDVFKRISNHQGNGQSDLLQEIRDQILETYSTTSVSGDGQVVVIEFSDGSKMEILPAFEQSDGSFKHPDSNDGGSWKTTNPQPEIDSATKANSESGGIYSDLCRMLRKWKNRQGFAFKGLLIDTLVYKFLETQDDNDVQLTWSLVEELLNFLSQENPKQSYWCAMGSGQYIYDDGRFVTHAKKLLELLEKSKNKENKLADAFGFKREQQKAENEEFIEDKFRIDIRYDITLDCDVTADGFRTMKLSEYLFRGLKLKNHKHLTFQVVHSDIPEHINVKYYWKVRNIGLEAVGKERGEILRDKKFISRHKESADFSGPHYVECYAVSNGVVIAMDHIDVPIDTENGY